MALFNRSKKNKNEVPAEIQEYYQAEKRDRTGIAWLLAFATLVVTILLAAGIFFAGRWAYRKIAGSDNQNTSPQTAQNENQQQEQQQPESSDESEDAKRAEEERQREEQEAEARAAEERRAQEDERKAKQEQERKAREEADRRENTETPAELPAGDDAASDRQVATETGNIPETGPGDTLAIFIAVTLLGYMAHRIHFAQKTK